MITVTHTYPTLLITLPQAGSANSCRTAHVLICATHTIPPSYAKLFDRSRVSLLALIEEQRPHSCSCRPEQGVIPVGMCFLPIRPATTLRELIFQRSSTSESRNFIVLKTRPHNARSRREGLFLCSKSAAALWVYLLFDAIGSLALRSLPSHDVQPRRNGE